MRDDDGGKEYPAHILADQMAEREGFEPLKANNRKPSFSVLYVVG